MNEDESFIRAIVDSPGDDLPRLVYADWLDDRDDPRGAYLRAEYEAVETGDVARLRQLAAGLDPVWVSRVSMPPVGVCLTHTELTERGPLLSVAEIASAEARLGVHFPADYAAFLLNYNGGFVADSVYFDLPDGPVTIHERGWRLYPVDRISPFALRPGDTFTAEQTTDWGLPPLAESVESWISRFIIVGHSPDRVADAIFLGVIGDQRGHVCILDTNVELERSVRDTAGYYATTFSEFLSQCSLDPIGVPAPPLYSPPEESDDPIPF